MFSASIPVKHTLRIIILLAYIAIPCCVSAQQPASAQPPPRKETYTRAGITPAAIFPAGIPKQWPSPEEACRWLPPTDRVLATAPSHSPYPLLSASFKSIASSMLLPAWLPERFDDAGYITRGKGGYQAKTTHLCKIYRKAGVRLILRGFAGEVVLTMQPVPVPVAQEILPLIHGEVTDQTIAGQIGKRSYQDSINAQKVPALQALFNNMRACLFVKRSQSSGDLPARMKILEKIHGGLLLSYSITGHITDPARKPQAIPDDGIDIWTNGQVAILTIMSCAENDSKIYDLFAPLRSVPLSGQLLHAPVHIFTRNEWENADHRAVPTLAEASHQRYYLQVLGKWYYYADIRLAQRATQLTNAAWLAVADRTVAELAENHIDLASIGNTLYYAKKQSNAQLLARLRQQHDNFVRAATRFSKIPCPRAGKDLQQDILAAAQREEACWNAVFPRLATALKQPDTARVTVRALLATLQQQVANPPQWDNEQQVIARASTEASRAIGIRITEDIYDFPVPLDEH